MTGAGFGGCAVALVRQTTSRNLWKRFAADFQAATKMAPNIYVCHAANGAEVVS